MRPDGWDNTNGPDPVLGGQYLEYTCRNVSLIPEGGNKVEVRCNYDGKFQYEDLYDSNGFMPENLFVTCVVGCVEFPSPEGFKPT